MIQIANQKQGNDTEMYVLHSNGNAQWMWIEVVGKKTNVLSEKSGKWNASANSISIVALPLIGSILDSFLDMPYHVAMRVDYFFVKAL